MRRFPLFPIRRRAQGGMGLIDVMAGLFIVSLITTLMLSLTAATSRSADRRTLENRMGATARTTLDEMLREIRAADQVLPEFTISGTKYKSDNTQIVVQAPGYDPASARVLLPGINDVVAFQYDASSKTLTETTLVGTGSKRPQRNRLRLAQRVESADFSYYVRDQFTAAGSNTFVLNARPEDSSKIKVYVNGVAGTYTYIPSLPTGTVQVNSPSLASGADVQFVYEASPTMSGGAWLPEVSRVDVTLTLSDIDGRRITRTTTLTGSARIRNWLD